VKLILVVILAVSSTAFAVWAPKISGNAVNELMNGFVAKSMVSEISKAQEQYLPEVKDMLQQLQSAQDAAVKAAQEEVAKQFSATLAKQKQDAYAQAEAAARKAIVSNPPKELTAAVQQAQAEVKKQFDAKVAAQKQAAYAQAETAAKQAIASNPPAELTAAIQQAQEAAKAAAKQQVDAQFAAQPRCAARKHSWLCNSAGCRAGSGSRCSQGSGSGSRGTTGCRSGARCGGCRVCEAAAYP